MHFLKLAVAIASLANQSCKACSGWVFAAVEKAFQWNYPAWSDAISADSDGCGAIEQPLEMIKSIGRSHTQTQTQTHHSAKNQSHFCFKNFSFSWKAHLLPSMPHGIPGVLILNQEMFGDVGQLTSLIIHQTDFVCHSQNRPLQTHKGCDFLKQLIKMLQVQENTLLFSWSNSRLLAIACDTKSVWYAC